MVIMLIDYVIRIEQDMIKLIPDIPVNVFTLLDMILILSGYEFPFRMPLLRMDVMSSLMNSV
jgi:hypothetical protein